MTAIGLPDAGYLAPSASLSASFAPTIDPLSWHVERSAGAAHVLPLSRGRVHILPAGAMPSQLLAQTDLASQVCDHRYYDIVHRTLGHDYPISYFVLYDSDHQFRGAQPFFIVDQNILAGVPGKIAVLTEKIRGRFPSFMKLKTLMLGNPAGPGLLGARAGATESERAWFAGALSESLAAYGKKHRVRIVVFKDFPAIDRGAMMRLTGGAASGDFARFPSMPMTSLALSRYASFEDYMAKALSKITRKGLRRKFKKAAGENIELSVTNDISDCADEVYKLYLQVYDRAAMKFEKLTPAYLRELCRRMPDRARFFLWRRNGNLVAVSITLVRFNDPKDPPHSSALYDLYLGMDYPLALDLSLYFLTMRDVIQWSIENKIATYYSTPLNYDAKLHFRHRLVPQDLYVRHTSPLINPLFQFAMRFAEPTRHDKVLPRFANAHELKGHP